jgi:RNA polymerase sigma factor (sigma-70 family)
MFTKQDHYEKVLSLWGPIREKMYWIILKITNDKGLAEDVLQEALITAIDKYQTLKDEGKFEPWFITISIRKAYELLAARKNYVQTSQLFEEDAMESDGNSDYLETFDALHYKDMIKFIFEHLPENKKYLFYLRYIEDRSMEDIMRITGMKEGTLKSIYHRMRKELSLLLAEEFDLHV